MGIKVNFVITSWQGSLDAVTNGEADFQSGMVPTDERKKLFDFADKETINTEEFLYVRRDLDISIPSQLGKIPVWTDGGISETLLKERFDGLNLLNADGYEVINEQIKNKTMDAFVMDDSIAAYNLAKFDATARYKKIYSVYRQPLYAAVAKGNSEMLKLVNEGNSKISAEEFNEIYNRYVATKIQYP